MNAKKLASRLIIFFVGVPAVLALVYFSQLNHLALHFLILACSILGTIEMHKMMKAKGTLSPVALLTILNCLPLLMSYFCSLFDLPIELIFLVFVFCALVCLAYEVIFSKDKEADNFSESLFAIIADVFTLFYCGLLPVFISQLCKFENSFAYLCTFFILCFGCDSMAWFFGVTMGKNNRGFIKISPNKSIAGFVGGILSTIGLAILCKVIFKNAFQESPYWVMALLGFFTSIAGIIGDLVESLLKRSTSIKDSGHIVIGRGGVLDSIDSLLFASPLFYAIIKLFIA